MPFRTCDPCSRLYAVDRDAVEQIPCPRCLRPMRHTRDGEALEYVLRLREARDCECAGRTGSGAEAAAR